MTNQEDTRRKSRRDLLLILLILPFGVLCMVMTGQAAIRLAPNWMLPVNMFSNLDPNAEFAGLDNPLFIEPLNSGILTQPAWDSLFLTPNAVIPTRVVAVISTPLPPARTPKPPPEVITPIVNPPPTVTVIGPALPTKPIPRLANLIITKTDNNNTYTPGTSISYTIVVFNFGPDDALRFNVVDNVPSVITGLTVSCTPVSDCGTNTSSGNTISFTNAFLSAKNQLTITANGLVASGATGNLSNTAEVIVPPNSGYRDIFEASNITTDTNTRLSIYDLAITKSDGIDTYVATDTQFNYTILVTNSGPSDALGITVTDTLPSGVTSWDWTCTTVTNASGCNGVTGSTTNFSDTVNIQSGGSIAYSVAANLAAITLPQNPPNIDNTARLVIPGGPGGDPNLVNNTATDNNAPYIDLQITKDDGVPTYTPGGAVTYTITVTNNSTFDLNGITVTDNMPDLISSWSWTCGPPPGPPSTASCTASGTGNINDTAVNLPAGGSVIYTINATVNGFAAGILENTASVIPPSGLVDAVPGDNTATDTNFNALGGPNIGLPDNIVTSPTGGTTTTYFFSPAITNDGTNSPDFVFYERDMAPGILFDNVIVELSTDGGSWTQVLNWGNNLDDTNTNMSLSIIGDGGNPSNPEYDDRPIPYAELYNNTGITIDIDSLGLSGSYPWIRFYCPTIAEGNTDDLCDIDAIQPYYP